MSSDPYSNASGTSHQPLATSHSASPPLVSIENLQTYFYTEEGVIKAVDDVSLVIPRQRTLGLVGESGCGKSVTAMSIIRLISSPGRIAGGRIVMHGKNG